MSEKGCKKSRETIPTSNRWISDWAVFTLTALKTMPIDVDLKVEVGKKRWTTADACRREFGCMLPDEETFNFEYTAAKIRSVSERDNVRGSAVGGEYLV